MNATLSQIAGLAVNIPKTNEEQSSNVSLNLIQQHPEPAATVSGNTVGALFTSFLFICYS